MKVYADHAATTQLDPDAFEAMKPFLLGEFGNVSQPYSFSQTPRMALKAARAAIAGCINAEPEEIFFTSGGTESDNWAVKSVVSAGANASTIITSQIEHHAILEACRRAERGGDSVIYLPPDRCGVIWTECLTEQISENTKLVSVMYANNEIGTIQPIRELCRTAHEKGALFHTDAVQAVGHIPIDVKALDVDMLSASAHKFNGPKGIGFLYIKKGTALLPYMDGGAQENRMRAGTENVAFAVAMAAALEKNCSRMESAGIHLRKLEKQLLFCLKQAGLDFIRNGSCEGIPGNISLSFKGAESEMLLHRLDFCGISVSAGAACDSVNAQISHVLNAIRIPKEYAAGTIRISFGFENTEEEAAYVSDTLIRILKQG